MPLTDRELVVFSPLPPTRSGIAAYTAELLPALGQALRTVVVVATARDVVEADGAEVIGVQEYRAATWLRRLPHLFQIGNSLDHAHVYAAAVRHPGIVVLHEPMLHHLVEALTLGRGDWAAYEAALAADHGPAGRRLARLRRAGLFTPYQRFLLPLIGPVVSRARGIIVHSRFAQARVAGGPLASIGAPPVRVVPHHASPRAAAFDALDRSAARTLLGLPPEGPILVSLGHVTPAKQIAVALRALGLLKRQGVAFRYVIGGQAEPGMDLPHLVREAGLEDRVLLTGWLSDDDFFRHMRAADLLINLRYPVAGESSGALAGALTMGLPALVYDYGPAAEYPDAVVAKLAFGADPAPAAAQAIAGLLADPAALTTRGRAAQAFMREYCSIDQCAAFYLQAIFDWDGVEK